MVQALCVHLFKINIYPTIKYFTNKSYSEKIRSEFSYIETRFTD